jgi:antitoxin ParD1/3/4
MSELTHLLWSSNLNPQQEDGEMSVKASVSISEQQGSFARRLVEEGQYSSVSAVVQRGLELLRERHESHEAELAALRDLLVERQKGPFLNAEESKKHLDELIAAQRATYGL